MVVVSACIFLLAVVPGIAQEEPASPTPAALASAATTPASTATPIPLADVISAADSDAERLAAIDSEVAANQTAANITRDLPELTKAIDARLSETRRTLTPGASLDTMRDLEVRWQAVVDQLAVWARDLTARATFLDRELLQLPELARRGAPRSSSRAAPTRRRKSRSASTLC
jgi:hypothetical protein